MTVGGILIVPQFLSTLYSLARSSVPQSDLLLTCYLLTLLVAHLRSCVKGAALDRFCLHPRNELGVSALGRSLGEVSSCKYIGRTSLWWLAS